MKVTRRATSASRLRIPTRVRPTLPHQVPRLQRVSHVAASERPSNQLWGEEPDLFGDIQHVPLRQIVSDDLNHKIVTLHPKNHGG